MESVCNERFKQSSFFRPGRCLCEDTDYITSLEKLHIYPFAKKAVEQIHKKGYLAIVVTNQSGVARGYLTEEMLQKLNAYLQKETGKVISKQAKRQERKPFLSKDGNAASSRIL